MTSFDPNSLSNIGEIITRHISLAVEANFEKKVLRGYVTLTAEALVDGTKTLVVDTKDGLTVEKVTQDGKELKTSTTSHPVFGTAIHADLIAPVAKGNKVQVTFVYQTSPQAAAIQWLDPSQTAGKTHPYLFTQCQAIHARSMLPCQDAPSVKATYDASIEVPSGLTAVMSAVSTGSEIKGNNMIFKFKQDVPMSSYLIALGIGNIESREIGPRSRVWSEKSMVDAGAYEFAETESFLKVAEDLLGPYVWGRYDVLLLPPSFPYGGMENPCLTFVTPTLLAGDRSNADVIAHEISHSWTGNLVTNRTWEHFWLNEGFTVFTERKIYGRLYNEQMRHFKSIIGWKALQDSVNTFGADSPLTALVPNLKDIDPDDAFSSVPYEKGFNFLFYLETLVGIEKFEKFLRAYIEKYKFTTLVTEEFKEFFLSFFTPITDQSVLDKIDWQTWFTKPGMPIFTPSFDQTLSNESKELANKWLNNQEVLPSDIKGWNAGQLVVFLDELVLSPQALSVEAIEKMDNLYSFSASKNAEIRFRWYQLCIRAEYEPAFAGAAGFLTEQGRMKFVRPLYRSMYRSVKGKKLAVETFTKHQSMYHNIAAKMIAKDLEIA